MINKDEWLEKHRAADKTDWVSFDYECDDDDLEKIKEAADSLGMDLNEYFNYALALTLDRDAS